MSIQGSAPSHSRLGTVLVVLALTAAVVAVAVEAGSIRSTTIGSHVQRVVPARPASAGVPTSIRIPKGCHRRKFGCAQDATTTADPARSLTSRALRRPGHEPSVATP